jgi:hypothetical protein
VAPDNMPMRAGMMKGGTNQDAMGAPRHVRRQHTRVRRLATINALYHMSAHSSADNPGIFVILAKYFCDGAWFLVRFDLISSLLFE